MERQAINHVAIRAVSSCVPSREVNNLDDSQFEIAEREKIIQMTGVHRRRIVSDYCASDLCFEAAKLLLKEVNCDPLSIDVLIFVSQTPDYILPATACILQTRLGLGHHVLAFDINLGCSGYTYGIIILAQILSSGIFKKGLLLAGDTISKLVSKEDRSVSFLFGDAGSATLLEFDRHAPPLFFDYGTDGKGSDKLIVEAGSFRLPNDPEIMKKSERVRSKSQLYMSGMDIFEFTLKRIPSAIKSTLEQAGWKKDKVDLYLFHQANEFMLKHLVKKIEVSMDKVLLSLRNYGNTSVASIPVTICSFPEKFAEKMKCHVLMSGFGVGFSWATLACVLKEIRVLPVIIYQLAEHNAYELL